MTYEDIIKDDKNFADGLEIEISGQKVKLGDIRNLTKKQQADVTQRLNELQSERENVKKLSEQAANLYATIKEQADRGDPGRTTAAPSPDEFETDPVWEPVRKRFKDISDHNKKLEESNTQLLNAMKSATLIFAEDRWQSQFERGKDRLKKNDKYKDWGYDKVRDYAAEHKILDKFGLPSVEKAIFDLTKEDELEAAKRDAYERGLKEGRTAGRMSSMARPTSATGPVKPEKSAVAERGLAGLGDDVANDPDLMQMLAEVGAIDPSEIQ